MSYLKKLYDIGEEKVNLLRRKQTNPLHDFELALQSLRDDMSQAMKQTAEYQALKIRSESDLSEYKRRSDEFERQAEHILSASLTASQPETVEKAAAHALSLKRMYVEKTAVLNAQMKDVDEKINYLKTSIEQMQIRIEHYEKEYVFLKSKYDQSKINRVEYEDVSDTDQKFEYLKNKLETMSEEYSKLDSLADDLYLADKHIHDAEIQNELEALKLKITPRRS